MQLAAGDRLGQYDVLGPLGAGGMGEVYRARDAKLGRDIAVKLLPPELASGEALRRFEQEARAASALNHPNIVTIYDIGQTEHGAWIAMELIDGTDLRTVAAKEPLSIKTALRIAVKIADGLAAAHDRGIVHRDLKPDNIMITPEGFVKILDFGLAKQMRVISSEETTIPHTSPGAVFGTVGYMSPEQAVGKEMDYRSDQFSFGVLLYEMLTRVRPFDRETKPETMAAIIRHEVEAPSTINEAITYDLDRIVFRCLAKSPRDRYASTRDLARDLREIRDGLTHSSTRIRPVPRTRPPHRFRPAWIAAAAIVSILLSGAGYVWTQRGRAAAGQRIASLAVVPFRDLSATGEGRILADGISELIATRLAEVKDLRVSSPFDGARVADGDPVSAIARSRGVNAVVRGTVQRGGDMVRVTYALIDAASGSTIVSSTATRPAGELFALEDSIAENLVRALGRQATTRPQPVSAALRPEDQRQFIEAVGLLQRVRDEKSVDRAIASLESILRNARDSGEVNALLARGLLYKASMAGRQELREQAMVYAARGVAYSPNDPETHITLARLLNATGRSAEAVASLQRALALRADHPDAVLGLAEAYDTQGRGADAEAMYRKALALQPDSSGAHIKFGAFCYNRGRYQEAETEFRKAIALVPDFARAWVNLGAALQVQNKNDEAMAAYRKSLALEPTAAGWSNLGTLQFAVGRYADARTSFQTAAGLSPSDATMWANLGDACSAAGDETAARGAYTRAITAARETLGANPGDAVTRSLYATCLARTGKLDDAQAQIRIALEGNPTDPVVLYQAAVVNTLRGAPESAVSWLERAVAAGYPAAAADRDPVLQPLRKLPSFSNAVKSSPSVASTTSR